MDKSEKTYRKDAKATFKRNQFCVNHNVIFVKKLNKLDKELDYITNKLKQEMVVLGLKSRMSTLTKITDILNDIKRLKMEIKYEKRNLDLDGNDKIAYPKRKALVKRYVNPLEQIFRELTLHIEQEREIPY